MDVSEASTNGVCCGSSPFAEAVRSLAKTLGGAAVDSFASFEEPTGDGVCGQELRIFYWAQGPSSLGRALAFLHSLLSGEERAQECDDAGSFAARDLLDVH